MSSPDEPSHQRGRSRMGGCLTVVAMVFSLAVGFFAGSYFRSDDPDAIGLALEKKTEQLASELKSEKEKVRALSKEIEAAQTSLASERGARSEMVERLETELAETKRKLTEREKSTGTTSADRKRTETELLARIAALEEELRNRPTGPPPETGHREKGPEKEKAAAGPRRTLIANYLGNDGVNLLSERSASASKPLGVLFQQVEIPLVQLGESIRAEGEEWVRVEVKGWISTSSRSNTYLAKSEHGRWEVTWNRPGDAFVAMRTEPASSAPLVARVSHGTVVEELDTMENGDNAYILARFTGWAVKETSSDVYLREINL